MEEAQAFQARAGSSEAGDAKPLLIIRNLRVRLGRVQAVQHASLTLYAGQAVALVGESGSGKSVTAMSVLGLLPDPPYRESTGTVVYDDGGGPQDLLTIDRPALTRVRGGEIAMIFQEPMTSLNPVLTIGKQLSESAMLHVKGETRAGARRRAIQALTEVGIDRPAERIDQYPHEFSGGMRQRVMIAMALMGGPRVLIADEPTTALDVSARAAMLELLGRLRAERGLGVLLITHDLHTVQQSADVVCVMRAGRVLEYGRTAEVFARPLHSYTRGLMQCEPSLLSRGKPLSMVDDQPNGGVGGLGRLCEVEPNRWVRVYDEVDLPSESSRSGSHPDIEPGHRAPLSSRGSPTTPGPFG